MYSIVELMDLAENPTMVYFTITKSKPNICLNLFYNYYIKYQQNNNNPLYEYFKIFDITDREYYYRVKGDKFESREDAKKKLYELISTSKNCINIIEEKAEPKPILPDEIKQNKPKVKKNKILKTSDPKYYEEYRKKYYSDNKDKLKEYYIKNKEKILTKNKEKYNKQVEYKNKLETLQKEIEEIKNKLNN
jgi:hypothetical protein